MSAADEIRNGQRLKFAALQEAGINTTPVVYVVLRKPNYRPEIGEQPMDLEEHFEFYPWPSIEYKQTEVYSPAGLMVTADVILKGAFPESATVKTHQFKTQAQGIRTFRYQSPMHFIECLQRANHVLIRGEKFVFGNTIGGISSVKMNNTLSRWEAKLVRADKPKDKPPSGIQIAI